MKVSKHDTDPLVSLYIAPNRFFTFAEKFPDKEKNTSLDKRDYVIISIEVFFERQNNGSKNGNKGPCNAP